jgi:hypothetical protein
VTSTRGGRPDWRTLDQSNQTFPTRRLHTWAILTQVT